MLPLLPCSAVHGEGGGIHTAFCVTTIQGAGASAVEYAVHEPDQVFRLLALFGFGAYGDLLTMADWRALGGRLKTCVIDNFLLLAFLVAIVWALVWPAPGEAVIGVTVRGAHVDVPAYLACVFLPFKLPYYAVLPYHAIWS